MIIYNLHRISGSMACQGGVNMQYIKSFSNSDVAIEYIKTKLKEDATYKIFSKEDMIFPDENPDPIAEYYIIQKEID